MTHGARGKRLLAVPRDDPVVRGAGAGAVDVVLVRRRFGCGEAQCPRRTFVQVTDKVPAKARRGDPAATAGWGAASLTGRCETAATPF